MSVAISVHAVKTIAALARLGLDDEEIISAAKDLSGILKNFSEVQKIDTVSTLPALGITGLSNVWREDMPKPEELCSHQELLKLAPEVYQSHIKVKAIF